METWYVVRNGSTGTFLVTAPQVLEIKGGEFTWSKDTPSPTLEDIDLVVRKGELTGIVGRVGAGKVGRNDDAQLDRGLRLQSSLLSAIIGDMRRIEGKVTVYGTVAYAPQNPWYRTSRSSLKHLILNPG
jgi:ABC-type transport system involved in cytochrome bd biosynthesis fused ATPase/permease subunit